LPTAPFIVRRSYLIVVARGAARGASQVHDRGAQACASTAACGDAMLLHQEKSTRQTSRGTEQIQGKVTLAANLRRGGVAGRSYLMVVSRPLPTAPFLVRRRYLIVVPRPLPAAPLAVRRTYLTLVLRSVPRPLPAAARRCRIREEQSADEQRNRAIITSCMCTVQVNTRGDVPSKRWGR